jgi:tripartite-type tricarboxylate transporter receptor subunit TctC
MANRPPLQAEFERNSTDVRSAMMSRRLFLTGVAGVATSSASGQSYPQRPVKIVVAVLPGTGIDLVARTIADRMSAMLKQPFIVENRPGAAGNLGAEAVSRSAPDGHTLLAALNTTFTVNPSLYKKLPFDPSADFRYISTVGKATTMLVVHSSIPINSVAEFVAYAKKAPISYAHGGPGSSGHLSMEYFGLFAGFQTIPVPYRGNTQLAADLAAGQIKFGFVATPGIVQHVRAGRLRGLAVSGRTRSPLAPDLPTIAEAGYPDFEYESYYVLAAPAGIPDLVAALLERDVRQALASSLLEERFRAQDIVLDWAGSAETKARIEADARLWAMVVKAAGMHVD